MNKSPIEWTEFTFNPIFGCLGPGGTKEKPKRCWYCYAEDVAANPFFMKCPKCLAFEPHIHSERIYEPLKRKKPATIFVGSMSDMWGDWVPAEWIESVLQVIEACPQHTFLMLTKNWKRYGDFECPDNMWFGITLTGNADLQREESAALLAASRRNYFISFEPLLDDASDIIDAMGFDYLGNASHWQCLIIGPLNKRGYPPVTKREWVERIIEIADSAGVPVFLKNALYEKGIMTEAEVKQRQQTPWRA